MRVLIVPGSQIFGSLGLLALSRQGTVCLRLQESSLCRQIVTAHFGCTSCSRDSAVTRCTWLCLGVVLGVLDVLEWSTTAGLAVSHLGVLYHTLPPFESLATALPPDSRPIVCFLLCSCCGGLMHWCDTQSRGSRRRVFRVALAATGRAGPSLLRPAPFCQASLGRGSTTSVSSACIPGQAEEAKAKGFPGMAPPWRAPTTSESLQPPG